MKAIRIHEYGDRSVLRCENAPEPGLLPGDVLIRVQAAGVNPADWQFRRGDFQAFAPLQFPAILGWDVAGIVEQVGATVPAHDFARSLRGSTPAAASADRFRVWLEDVALTHACSESRHARGKILLVPASQS